MSEQTAAQPAIAQPAEMSSTQPQAVAPGAEAAKADGAKQPTAAELKKKAKEEKQARRAALKGTGPQGPPPTKEFQKKPQKDGKPAPKDEKKAMPWRRPSQSHGTAPKDLKIKNKDSKTASRQPGLFFGHLYSQPRQHSMVGATKDVHPAILQLGLHYSSYVICGSTARMVSMLLAFKAVIESYHTPMGTSLARHLTSHHLSPQIDYLRICRPLSISMGNAVRWLKDLIIKIDPSTPEAEAKRELISEIDDFIRDRVTAADKLIAEYGEKKIENGDVILTYASSSIVEKTILHAHKAGTSFSVIVVDSKPLFEGKQLARKLANHGIAVKYFLITGASHAVKQASKVLLGAHAMMSNGRLYSRVGTALVSMLAKAQSSKQSPFYTEEASPSSGHKRPGDPYLSLTNCSTVPVIVLCEAIKFTERVALDSIVGNEMAPAAELLSEKEREDLLPMKPYLPQGLLAKLAEKDGDEERPAQPGDVLKWIEGSENLQMLQVLYDVTPAEYIDMVITEYGSLPPSSVPVVHRLSTDKR